MGVIGSVSGRLMYQTFMHGKCMELEIKEASIIIRAKLELEVERVFGWEEIGIEEIREVLNEKIHSKKQKEML